MNQYLLYILPFKNGQHFKFGITKVQSLDRIKSLNKTYELDIEKSFIYRGEKTSIIEIENKLKEYDFLEVDEYLGIDGYTEIRSIQELENTIRIVESYQSFSLQKESLSNYEGLVKVKKRNNKVKRKENVRTSGKELPNLELNFCDILDIEISYESTKK